MKEYTCGNCGMLFKDYESNRKKTRCGFFFCSMACRGKYQTKLARERAPVKADSTCVRCGETKPVSEFYKDKKCVANGGVQYACRSCVKLIRQEHYDANAETINARIRTYKAANPGRKGKAIPYNKAHRLLNTAVRNGLVIKPDTCSGCEKRGKRLHGHHHKGYDYPLDVVWLCPGCHHAAHGRGPKARTKLKENNHVYHQPAPAGGRGPGVDAQSL